MKDEGREVPGSLPTHRQCETLRIMPNIAIGIAALIVGVLVVTVFLRGGG